MFRHASRRAASVLILGFAAVLLSSSPAGAQSFYWFESYERAVSMVDAGSFSEASEMLDSLIESHPLPVVGMRVPGDRFIDYVPYFERARIAVAGGDLLAASHNLDICEAFGVSDQNNRMARKIATLRKTITDRHGAKASIEPATPGTSTAALH